MQEKTFEGQYSGEKILLRTHPHVIFFVIKHFSMVASMAILLVFCFFGAVYFPAEKILFAIASVVIIVGYIWAFLRLYRASRYTITSRRCIYFVPKTLFKKSYNEIHLIDLRTAVPKRSMIGSIFGYGKLILTDKDDKKIVYEGLFENKFVARYLSRVIDYIKIHGHTDNISVYQNRKERENSKNNF